MHAPRLLLHLDRSSIPTSASKTRAKRIRNAEVRFRNLTGDRRAYVRSEQWGFACPLPSAVTA